MKPTWLSVGAGVVWDELAPICLAMKTLTMADLRPFATLCELQATFTAAVAKKDTTGFNPRIERDTATAMRPYYALFGLEPISRAKIHVPPQKPALAASKWEGALK